MLWLRPPSCYLRNRFIGSYGERESVVKKRVRAARTNPRERSVATLVDIRNEIRAAGMRSTAPRISVLERLRRADAPLSHAEITEELLPMGFDRATIYRNLVDLAEAGLVSRVELGDHVWRYEVRGQGREPREGEGEHPHFVCNDCGTVSCLPTVSIDIRPAPGSRRSPVAAVSDIVLKGRCESC
ncbi:MAG: transcriptional repressor [Deltaproteobacteria bacterium]|nr:transcriptional repressor [Deltaproteobacteria bacterium]